MEQPEKHYGLFTTISMIVGICVGSGIFFKADNILILTHGNVFLSVLVFIIAALCVALGSITIAQLSVRTNASGGIVAYFDEFISKAFGNGFGWFYLAVYYPTILSVVAWVAGLYSLQLLGLPSNLELEMLIGLIFIICAFAMNYLSTTLAGRFQNLTTIGKLVPLIGIGLVSFFWADPSQTTQVTETVAASGQSSFSWIAAIIPVAFSFEGWIVATSIAPEVKNPHRTMPLALLLGPIIVLAIYLAYFIGIINIGGVDDILTLGDGIVSVIGMRLLGSAGDKILTAFILLAVTGVINGLTLGFIRLPQAMALRGFIPNSEKVKRINFRRGLSLPSVKIAFGLTMVWMIVHYFVQKNLLLGAGDISEIAIVFNYVGYILLYVEVIKLSLAGEIPNKWLGIVVPSLAIVGSLMIIIGGYVSNPTYLPFFLLFCFVVSVAGYIYNKRQDNKETI